MHKSRELNLQSWYRRAWRGRQNSSITAFLGGLREGNEPPKFHKILLSWFILYCFILYFHLLVGKKNTLNYYTDNYHTKTTMSTAFGQYFRKPHSLCSLGQNELTQYPNWVRKYLYSVSSVLVSVSVPHSAAPRLGHRPAWIRYRSSCARHLRVLSLWSVLGLGHGPSARAGPCNMSWVLTSERTLCNGAEPQHCALRCYSVERLSRGRGEKWGRRREKNGSCYAFL